MICKGKTKLLPSLMAEDLAEAGANSECCRTSARRSCGRPRTCRRRSPRRFLRRQIDFCRQIQQDNFIATKPKKLDHFILMD